MPCPPMTRTTSRRSARADIAVILAEMAAQARRRGGKVSHVLGPVQPLLDYQYGPAIKAAATRKKAAEAEAKAGPTG